MAQNSGSFSQPPQAQRPSTGTQTVYDPVAAVGPPGYNQPAPQMVAAGGYAMAPGYGAPYLMVPAPPAQENNNARNVVIGLVIACCVVPALAFGIFCCVCIAAGNKPFGGGG